MSGPASIVRRLPTNFVPLLVILLFFQVASPLVGRSPAASVALTSLLLVACVPALQPQAPLGRRTKGLVPGGAGTDDLHERLEHPGRVDDAIEHAVHQRRIAPGEYRQQQRRHVAASCASARSGGREYAGPPASLRAYRPEPPPIDAGSGRLLNCWK
jgi:hypothetical protein